MKYRSNILLKSVKSILESMKKQSIVFANNSKLEGHLISSHKEASTLRIRQNLPQNSLGGQGKGFLFLIEMGAAPF